MKYLSNKNKLKFLIIVLLLFLGIVITTIVLLKIGGKCKTKSDKLILLKQKIQRNEIKNFVCKKIPEIKQVTTDLEKIRLLRNFVYKNTVIGPNNRIDYQNFGIKNIKNWYDQKDKYLCGNMAFLFDILAKSFNFESRIVQMYTNSFYNGKYGCTHVTNEIKIDNHWVAQDPTFNIEFKYNDKLLNYKDLYTFNENDYFKRINIETNGFKILPKRSLMEYYLPYNKFLKNIRLTTYDYKNNKFIVKKNKWLISNTSSMYDRNKLNDYKVILDNISIKPVASSVKISKTSYGHRLTTNHNKCKYQAKQNFNLEPGKYFITIEGKLLKGNISLGILSSQNKWISQVIYEASSNLKKSEKLVSYSIPFILNKEESITFIISNSNFTPNNSMLFFKDIKLLKKYQVLTPQQLAKKKQLLLQKKAKIRKYLFEQITELKTTINDLKKVRLVRNFVYKNTIVDNNNNKIETINDFKKWQNGKITLNCGDMSHLFGVFLDCLNIKSKRVQLYANSYYKNKKVGDTHVATGVLIDGRWIIEDPTFNIEFFHNGKAINFTELFNLNEAGKYDEVSYSSNGYKIIAGETKNIAEYYLPYDKLLSVINMTDYSSDFSNQNHVYLVSKRSFLRTGIIDNAKIIPLNLRELKKANKGVKFTFKNNILEVVSNRSRGNYQVVKNLKMAKGNYLLSFKGNIHKGNIALGVIDNDKNKWLTSNVFNSNISKKYKDIYYTTPFNLKKNSNIKITISNCNKTPDISKFDIKEIKLIKLKD